MLVINSSDVVSIQQLENTPGFDGHSLRAAFYFKAEFEAEGLIIDMTDPKSVNQIKKLDHPLRSKSKAPTFLLTYGGTHHGLILNCGFDEAMAKAIEASYHKLYVVSDRWVQDRLNQAAKDGYVTLAFGLRLRTPMLKQVVRGTRNTPFEAEAEGRTAGNALGQGWGMLNSRSANEFNALVRQSPYRLDIRHCGQIHDAQYYLVREDLALVGWMNRELVRCVQWQDHPEIAHPTVKLGGELSIFYPTWADELTIPNGATEDQIYQLAQDHLSRE